jgi:hypothetical protein
MAPWFKLTFIYFQCFFFLSFYHCYLYLHVYTLFVPPPPSLSLSPPNPLPGKTCSALFFSSFVEEKTGDYKKAMLFLLF